MSFYATIAGHIQYKDERSFQAAVALLEEGGWLKNGLFLDERDRVITPDSNVDPESWSITIPLALHRNLAYQLGDDQLFADAEGRVVWTSTDGTFSGGVVVHGSEESYDLNEWARQQEDIPPPAEFDEIEAYCRWQQEVEQAFLDTFREE